MEIISENSQTDMEQVITWSYKHVLHGKFVNFESENIWSFFDKFE